MKKRHMCAILILLVWIEFSRAADINPGPNRDYFDINDRETETMIYNVEKYHLSAETFWKWFNARKYDLALDELRFVLRYFPNHPKALQLLGAIAKLKKSPSLALPYYEKALMLYPQHALTHAQFGEFLVDIGRIKEGVASLERAIEIDPKLALAYDWLSKAYIKIGNTEMARQAAEKARELGLKTGQ